MPLNRRTIEIVERFDRALDRASARTSLRMQRALEQSYNRLERELLRKYRANADNLDLLPNQRKLLILGQLRNNLDLITGKQGRDLQRSLTAALRRAGRDGAELARRLAKQIGNVTLEDFDAIPIEALRFQAEQGIDRLKKHGREFADRVSSIVEIGLTTGAGPRKVATEMRKALGITKGRADMLAKTETLNAHNQATEAAYRRSDIQYFQYIATVDGRTCPFCASRNMKVYPLGQSTPPIHPRCRCYQMPWKAEWQEIGLTNDAFAEQFRADTIAELQANGRKPDNGPSPFERLAGLGPPEPFWEP